MVDDRTASAAARIGHDALATASSALVADALDTLGLRRQCLGPEVNPLRSDQRLLGPAFTVLARPAVDERPDPPYAGLLAALDVVAAGEVFVFATGRSDAAGVWGELITTACLARGVAGAVTDGLVRDVDRVATSGFPVFGRGTLPYDSKGRLDVVAHAVEVEVDGVAIRPGDVLVGDADGVVVVPVESIDDVAAAVDRKRAGEDAFRSAVASGTSVAQAFRTHGVL